ARSSSSGSRSPSAPPLLGSACRARNDTLARTAGGNMPQGGDETPCEPRELRGRANGHELAVFDWPGVGTPVLFVHATGFHARCWDQVIRQLPGRHCLAVDVRGHGRSEKAPLPYDWLEMSVDLRELLQGLGIAGALGVGHSMGGFLVAAAAGARPALFS